MRSFKPVRLDARLRAVAAYVRPGSILADIGTDHGYLPVWLLQNQLIRHAIACDIHSGPLQSAMQTARLAGTCEQQIEFRLSDGLMGLHPAECTDIVIAGMGGELICSILSGAGWICHPDYNLILNPMTKANVLRRGLCTAGFAICGETAVCAGGKLYTVIQARYAGRPQNCTPLFAAVGLLQKQQNPAALAYKQHVASRLLRQAAGLRRQNPNNPAVAELEQLAAQIQQTL